MLPNGPAHRVKRITLSRDPMLIYVAIRSDYGGWS